MGLTAFPQVEQALRRRIRRIDKEAFLNTKLSSCARLYKNCWGMCCSLFVGLSPEEALVLSALVKEKRRLFLTGKHSVPRKVVDHCPEDDRYFLWKKLRCFSQLFKVVNAFISRGELNMRLFHDLSSTCVFSAKDGACVLEKIAELEGRHRWYYKPINCWKYPLSIDETDTLTVINRQSNPHFPCNKERNAVIPAVEGLREELRFLGAIVGRDLIAEITS